MGDVIVKYLLKNEVVTSEIVEKNKNLFDNRCFQSKEKTDAILTLRKLPYDVTLYIDENFNLTNEPTIPEME